MPSGARWSSHTMTIPKTMTSKSPACPSSFGRSPWSQWSTRVTIPEPSTAPHTAPMPPTTPMNRYSMPAWRLNGVGFTKRWKWA